MAEMPHYCSACGEVHGGSTGKSPEVEVARINAERDIRVAELTRGEFKPTPAELDTQVQVAEIEADAQVGAAEAIGDALSPDSEELPPAAEPVVDELDVEEEMAEEEPPEVTSSPVPRAPKKPSHWDLYS